MVNGKLQVTPINDISVYWGEISSKRYEEEVIGEKRLMKRRRKNIRKRSKKEVIIITAIVMVIVVGGCIFYRFHQEREQEMTEDGWVNVELKYIGSAKTDCMKNNMDFVGDSWLKKDGVLTYVYSEEGGSYEFLHDYSDFQRVNQWYEFYDLDFDPQSSLEKDKNSYYVFSLFRRLEWLQYKPDEISQFGGVLNRAGKEWDAETEEDTVYFYEFEYSGKHRLADVSMEF